MVCGVMVIALPTSIIGSNFVQEWQLYSRMKFQARLRRNRKLSMGIELMHRRKEEQLKVLRVQNETLLYAVEEIQDRLSEVNPPFYYRKYKEMKSLYEQTLDRLTALESENERLNKELTHLRHKKPGAIRSLTSPPGFFNSRFNVKSRQLDSPLSPILRMVNQSRQLNSSPEPQDPPSTSRVPSSDGPPANGSVNRNPKVDFVLRRRSSAQISRPSMENTLQLNRYSTAPTYSESDKPKTSVLSWLSRLKNLTRDGTAVEGTSSGTTVRVAIDDIGGGGGGEDEWRDVEFISSPSQQQQQQQQ